ncbi:hypothetical protein D3C71_2131740 [compost metagenome]
MLATAGNGMLLPAVRWNRQTARRRTATNCLPGSSILNRPENVPGRVFTVMSQVSMTSTSKDRSCGLTNRRYVGWLNPK